jgi:hypothetical protein
MPFLGVNSPLRLLRAKWDDPWELAKELYAMFTAKGPVEHEGPVTIKTTQRETALRIVQSPEPDTFEFHAGSGLSKQGDTTNVAFGQGRARRPPPSPLEGTSLGQAATEPDLRQRRSAPEVGPPASAERRPEITQAYRSPALEVEGPTAFRGASPVQFERAPLVFNESTRAFEPVQIATAPPVLDAGDNVSLGQVLDGAGDTYTVMLLPNGTTGEPGDVVHVSIPGIAPSEQISPGTYIGPIFHFGNDSGDKYECIVPVWQA